MGDCIYNLTEIRILTHDPDITHAHSLVELVGGDCGGMEFVGGWYYKAFPPYVSPAEILEIMARETLECARGAPKPPPPAKPPKVPEHWENPPCVAVVREIRLLVPPTHTDVYVRVEQESGRCPSDVSGWYHKSFPPEIPTLEILKAHFSDHILWPRKEPERD